MELSDKDRELLMELQYNFPIVRRPFYEIAMKVGVTEDWVLGRVRDFVRMGIIRRIGALVNYKSRGLVAALVGVEVPGDLVHRVAEAVNADPMVTHNFLRDYKPYNLWYVTKARSREELKNKVLNMLGRFGLENYVILFAIRTYKIDVKFDLMRGVSRAKWNLLPEEVPPIESTGLPSEFFRMIRSIEVKPEPFNDIARFVGKSVDELGDLIMELKRVGVIRDFYATLDPESIGFRENAMVVFSIEPDRCGEVASIEEATHVVHRETVPGKWPYDCYFMIHGVSKEVIESTVSARLGGLGVRDYRLLYSIENLLPTMARRLELGNLSPT
ncbi:Lrp/AsnC family transcriptional regulator [Vulcanisaeta thermophila]|uniref:Lrp/AsnC family transcriptional regulator n=1 Tax=Vulcanisaeta thermophila TaxID=867917 RepID=UPI000AC843FE|nr:Lrp/AsnC family transcriptional regulator [Vulcanisaeta thermophila]